MVISSAFESDIQSKNTQLFPLVVIEHWHRATTLGGFIDWLGDLIGNDDIGDEDSPEHIFLSTNNITVDGDYYKPILLNIPSIKESVDIESRKFKISNVSLDISNIEYEGKRFSDILSETSLMNTSVSIYIKSPLTTTVTTSWAGEPNPENGCPRIYVGIIRRISHDDTKVKIELEDLTEKKAHKNLPSESVADLESISDKARNQVKPMVYGEVDRSPLIMPTNGEFIVDYKAIEGGVESSDMFGGAISPLYMSQDELYINVKKEGQFTGLDPDSYSDDKVLFNVDNDKIWGVHYEGENALECKDTSKKYSIHLSNSLHTFGDTYIATEDFIENGDIKKVNDGSYDVNDIKLNGQSSFNLNNTGNETVVLPNKIIEQLLLKMTISFIPTYDHIDGTLVFDKIGINGLDISDILDFAYQAFPLLSGQIQGGFEGVFSQIGGDPIFNVTPYYDMQNAIINTAGTPVGIEGYVDNGTAGVGTLYNNMRSLFNFTEHSSLPENNPDAALKVTFTSSTSLDSIPVANFYNIILFHSGSYGSLEVDFRSLLNINPQPDSAGQGAVIDSTALIEGNLSETDISRSVYASKIFSKDFYANVKGRINTFDDHPIYNFSAYDFIEHPIDVIYDLVRSELGHDAIDELEHYKVRLAHKLPDGTGWKFGFTINKKINSKKLIEDIAKSTKCFPKFKNDGTFGFSAIKDNYSVTEPTSDHKTATLIKESEVISYSFKKTSPEQIYLKVDVSYNKDYAQDSYLSITPTKEAGGGDYYGIESREDAHLQFESDYIRDESTALALRDFLAAQYKNDHLIFNLKLPLQYIHLEIGGLVRFQDLLDGLKPYGIDYRKLSMPNAQYYYPLFMITATTKNLDSVSIECIQLHHLKEGNPFDNWFADSQEGDDFYFPDSDPIVIAPSPSEPFDPEDYAIYDGVDIEISGNVFWADSYWNIGVDDDFDYSELLGDANYFTVSGISNPTEPDFGISNLLYISHSYNIDHPSGYPNRFKLMWGEELDNNGDGIIDDITNFHNFTHPFNFTEGEQITITLSSYTLPDPTEFTATGDVNLDGVTNILDVVQIVEYIRGNQELSEEQIFQGDVNNSGGVNILDVVQIVNGILP